MEKQFIFGEYGWFNYGNYWEIDHIISLSMGGEHSVNNLQILTIIDNRKKGNTLQNYGKNG